MRAILVTMFMIGAVSNGPAQQSAVYAQQFQEAKSRTDALYREFSNRKIGQIKLKPGDDIAYIILTEPMARTVAVQRMVMNLNTAIQNGMDPKDLGPDVRRMAALVYGCSALSLMLDALEKFLLYGDRFLELATAQQLAITSALKIATE
jgi:hypothetical protein